jgi:hypothetical protein
MRVDCERLWSKVLTHKYGIVHGIVTGGRVKGFAWWKDIHNISDRQFIRTSLVQIQYLAIIVLMITKQMNNLSTNRVFKCDCYWHQLDKVNKYPYEDVGTQ